MFSKVIFTAAIIIATFTVSFATTNDKDQDVAAILAGMGIDTEVDEVELNETYTLLELTQEGDVFTFNLPAKTYTLEVIDPVSNLVAFYQDVDATVDVDMTDLASGKYIYKITENNNTYAGVFTVN